VDRLPKFGFNEAKTFGVVSILVLLIVLLNLPATRLMVESKAKSYSMLKEAGQYVGSRSSVTDSVIAGSTTTIEFYSMRTTYSIPPNETALMELIALKKPKFIVVDTWEYTQPPYIFELVQNRTDFFVPTQVFQDEKLSKQANRFIGSAVFEIIQ